MKKSLYLFFLAFFLLGFSSKSPSGNQKQYLTLDDCNSSFLDTFKKENKGSKYKMDQIITAYKIYPCFPLESIKYINNKHPENSWILTEIAKLRVLSPLSQTDELLLTTTLIPFVKRKSEIEKHLLKSIELKKNLQLSFTEDLNSLWSKFPSHNPNRLEKPNLSVVKDLKRRGQSTQALKVLLALKAKDPSNLKVQREIVAVQKNIGRNALYLLYSQNYVNAVYKRYKRKRSKTYYKDLYVREALKNIRRIWTYQSTQTALKKLNTLIKYHCRPVRICAEHYWIKGRIFEELNSLKQAHIWLKKAVENTSLNDSEYQNRVWNLVWLESKILGPKPSLHSANLYLSNINAKDIHSKLYYWMSKWSESTEDREKYIGLIKKHHPMSFYLWSSYALGQGIELKTQNFLSFQKSLHSIHEKNLLRIMEARELSVAQAYIKHIERSKKIKKTLSWKRLKALNGMYVDLLLDLEAGLITASENLQFFFSRGFYDDVLTASERFSIEKELIWSITRQESNFNPYARSWADAFGLMQILPKRAVSYLNDIQEDPKAPPVLAVNPFTLYNPKFNISVGAWLLRENLRNFDGKLPLAIAAYNASVGKVEEWERRFYKGDWMSFMEEVTYRETRKYVKLVLRNKEIYTALEKASNFNEK